MAIHPRAIMSFIPLIFIATFTVPNLFTGTIVSTMQEPAVRPEESAPRAPRETADQLLRQPAPDLGEVPARPEHAARRDSPGG